jgi:hypothetical protein
MLYGSLNRWQLYIAEGTKREMWPIAWGNREADREAKQVALTRGPAPTVLMFALFPCPLAEWDPWYTPQKQA